MLLDQAMSKLPQLVSTVSNLATQIGTGYSNEDTAIYLALNSLKDNYTNSEWEDFGQNAQLFFSSLLKYVTPATNADITFLS